MLSSCFRCQINIYNWIKFITGRHKAFYTPFNAKILQLQFNKVLNFIESLNKLILGIGFLIFKMDKMKQRYLPGMNYKFWCSMIFFFLLRTYNILHYLRFLCWHFAIWGFANIIETKIELSNHTKMQSWISKNLWDLCHGYFTLFFNWFFLAVL